jgi:uncharacterized protein YigE (DUF2233 family)
MPAGGAAVESEAGDALVEDARSYPVKSWRMPLAMHEVTIEDVGMTTALDAVLDRTGGALVVNGGFFDESGKALGLTMSNGIQLSRTAKKLSGGILTIDASSRARLHEAESFALPEGTRFAVQCRPRLVVGGQPNVKSDDGKRSERTALCLRDEGRTIDVVLVRGDEGGPSLYALGRWLAARGCEDALNLDGGPSAGAAWRDEEASAKQLLAPRGPVRHAIVFTPRDRRPSARGSR